MAQAREVFLFNPTSITGCQLWLDGADPANTGIPPAIGSSITTWTDKSGKGNNYTNSGTITYTARGLSFSGSALMQNTTQTGYPFGATPSMSTFVVFSYTSLTATGGLFQYGNVSCNKTGYLVYVTNDPTLGNLGLGTLYCGLLNVNGSVTANTTNIISDVVTYTSPSGSLSRAGYVNGSAMNNRPTDTTTGVNLTSSGTSRIADTGVPERFIGIISEIIFFNKNVSTTERQQIEGYLAWKWGAQTSLPSTHPFRNYRTLMNPPITTLVPNMPILIGNAIPFRPTDIANCALWLDGVDPSNTGIQPANGSTLTSWVDKSGNGRTLGVGSGTTTWNTNSVRLNSSYMFVTSAVNLTNCSFFIVVQSPTATNNQTVFTGRPNTGGFSYNSLDGFGYYVDNQNGTRVYGVATAGQFTQVTNTGSTAIFMTSAVFNSTGAISSWTNGGAQLNATTSARASTAQGFAIGAEWQNTVYGNIFVTSYIYEVIVYTSALTTAQRQQVEGYLAWKWGLTLDPFANQPYAVVPLVPFPFRSTAFVGSFTQWLPRQVSGLTVWIDPADPSVVSLTGTTITSITDKSTNAAVFNVGTTKPDNTVRLNGLQVMNFGGGSTNVLATASTTPYNTITQFSLFVAMRPTYASGSIAYAPCMFAIRSAGGTTISWHIHPTYYYVAFNGTANSNPSGQTPAQNELSLFTVVQGSTFYNSFKNGIAMPFLTYTISSQTGLPASIGNSYSGNGEGWVGQIAEVVFYNRAVSTDEQQRVEGYLAWKWGLQANLALSHPFKFNPPAP